MTYGSGAVSGIIGADTVTVAGMTLENYSMGATLQESVQFGDDNIPFDGLMGLAMNVSIIGMFCYLKLHKYSEC